MTQQLSFSETPIERKKTEIAKTTLPNEEVVVLDKKQEAIIKFSSQLEKYEKKVLPELLKEHNISPAKFITTVINEVKKNPKLLEAFMINPSSMFASILAGAEIGLMPSELTGHFFLIPRKMKQSDGSYKSAVCPLIGYKGLVQILLRGGDIVSLHTEVVYEGDEFKATFGLEPNIVHIPNFAAPRLAANITHVYAVSKHKSGEYQFAVMSRKQIEAVRDISPYPNSLYFNDTMGINRWMERKVALTQLSKMISKDFYSQKAISIDAISEGGGYLELDSDGGVDVIKGVKTKKSMLDFN